MSKLAILLSVRYFERPDVEQFFSGKVLSEHACYTLAEKLVCNEHETFDLQEHVRVVSLEFFVELFNNEEIKESEWWIVLVDESPEKDSYTFEEIKDEAHDISGIADPHNWLYRKQYGIWYPSEGI